MDFVRGERGISDYVAAGLFIKLNFFSRRLALTSLALVLALVISSSFLWLSSCALWCYSSKHSSLSLLMAW